MKHKTVTPDAPSLRRHSMRIIPGSGWVRTMTWRVGWCHVRGAHLMTFPRQDYGVCVRCHSTLTYCWTN